MKHETLGMLKLLVQLRKVLFFNGMHFFFIIVCTDCGFYFLKTWTLQCNWCVLMYCISGEWWTLTPNTLHSLFCSFQLVTFSPPIVLSSLPIFPHLCFLGLTSSFVVPSSSISLHCISEFCWPLCCYSLHVSFFSLIHNTSPSFPHVPLSKSFFLESSLLGNTDLKTFWYSFRRLQVLSSAYIGCLGLIQEE